MGIKLGNLDISSFKVGSADCKVYLGETLLYSGGSQPQTLQWVEFNNGDNISGLDIYGVSGNAYELSSTFAFGGDDFTFDYSRDMVYCNVSGCYEYIYTPSDNVELVFSNIGCQEYYNSQVSVAGSTIKLLIYQ